VLACPEGHECERWIIMDPLGHVVGIGYIDRPGMLLAGFFEGVVRDDDNPREPMVPCPRGHTGGWTRRDESRWRCKECLAIISRRSKSRRREKMRLSVRMT